MGFFFKLVNVLYGFRTEQKLKQQMFQQMSLRPLEGMVAPFTCSMRILLRGADLKPSSLRSSKLELKQALRWQLVRMTVSTFILVSGYKVRNFHHCQYFCETVGKHPSGPLQALVQSAPSQGHHMWDPLPCDKSCAWAVADICSAEELPEGNCTQLCASMFFGNDGSCRSKGGVKKNRNSSLLKVEWDTKPRIFSIQLSGATCSILTTLN